MTDFQSYIKLLFYIHLSIRKACLATARFSKMYQCQYRCEVDSNTLFYAISASFAFSTTTSFSRKYLKINPPTFPARSPPHAANASARSIFTGGLNVNSCNSVTCSLLFVQLIFLIVTSLYILIFNKYTCFSRQKAILLKKRTKSVIF